MFLAADGTCGEEGTGLDKGVAGNESVYFELCIIV